MSDVRPNPDAFDDESPTTVTRVARDPLAFILGGAPDRSTTADDARSTRLEVHHTWRGTLLDTVHARQGTVTGGEATGHRWRLLGTDVAWVPRPLALVLPFAPPMLSEVDTRPRADLPLSGPGVPEGAVLPVFRQAADGSWEALIQPGWEAVVEEGDTLVDLSTLATQGRVRPTEQGAAVTVPEGGQLTVGIGEVELHARVVPAARKAPAGSWLDRLDLVFLGLLGLMGFIGACFGLLITALPGNPDSSYVDLLDDARIVIRPEQVPEEAPSVLKTPSAGASAERAKRDEGKRGQEVAKSEPGSGAQKAPEDQVIAQNAGVLGMAGDAGFQDGFGGSIGRDVLNGIGLLGGKGVERGTNGLGSRGDSLGGGGTVDGIGGVGVGCPPGAECTGGPGTHGGSWAKTRGTIDTNPDEVLLIGGIDGAQIDKVIKRNLAKFRYCYQRELQREPGLSGKVVNRFVIAKDGTVSKSETKSSSLTPSVDSCVARTMTRLQFPAPRGGGIAIISYPFVFTAH